MYVSQTRPASWTYDLCSEGPLLDSMCFYGSLSYFISELRFCPWDLMGQLSIYMCEQRRSVQYARPPLLAAPFRWDLRCSLSIEFWGVRMTCESSARLKRAQSKCVRSKTPWVLGSNNSKRPHFSLESELALNIENDILKSICDQGTLSQPFLCYFAMLSSHFHWKLWHRRKENNPQFLFLSVFPYL